MKFDFEWLHFVSSINCEGGVYWAGWCSGYAWFQILYACLFEPENTSEICIYWQKQVGRDRTGSTCRCEPRIWSFVCRFGVIVFCLIVLKRSFCILYSDSQAKLRFVFKPDPVIWPPFMSLGSCKMNQVNNAFCIIMEWISLWMLWPLRILVLILGNLDVVTFGQKTVGSLDPFDGHPYVFTRRIYSFAAPNCQVLLRPFCVKLIKKSNVRRPA